jgi:lipoprotein-anchoring transpeptidase ErfK/SrfK
MRTDTLLLQQAIGNAREALSRGDRQATRYWASRAADLAPEMEDPWLLLAAVAGPQASLEYLERALRINPSSPRARQGMEWARMRLGPHAPQPVSALPATRQLTVGSTAPAPKRRIHPALLAGIVTIACLLVTAAWLGSASAVFALISPTATDSASFAQVDIPKPTYTPTPTATFTPTPTVTPSPTATLVPTETATPVPTDTLIPTEVQYVPPTDPPPVYSGAKRILVDISQQHLYAYEGDQLVYSFVASTGMHNATKVGHFSILDHIDSAYGSTWDIWMPYWMGIYWAGSTENGIHALPLLPNGSLLWEGYLGTPISYGCVVLGTYEARELYLWAENGTPVDIQW